MRDVTRLLYLLNKRSSVVQMPPDGIQLLSWSEQILLRYQASQVNSDSYLNLNRKEILKCSHSRLSIMWSWEHRSFVELFSLCKAFTRHLQSRFTSPPHTEQTSVNKLLFVFLWQFRIDCSVPYCNESTWTLFSQDSCISGGRSKRERKTYFPLPLTPPKKTGSWGYIDSRFCN